MSGPSKTFNDIGERAAGLLDSLYDNTIGAMVERGRQSMLDAGAQEGATSVVDTIRQRRDNMGGPS
jgi:hypothetical protein